MPRENPESNLNNPIIFAEINMKEAEEWNGKEGERDLIIKKIKEFGIYKPNLLFRGFDANRIDIVKETGTDVPNSNEIFASKENELADEARIHESALDYALTDADKPALSVYDGEKMEGEVGYNYRMKPGYTFKEALIAVLLLKK